MSKQYHCTSYKLGINDVVTLTYDGSDKSLIWIMIDYILEAISSNKKVYIGDRIVIYIMQDEIDKLAIEYCQELDDVKSITKQLLIEYEVK